MNSAMRQSFVSASAVLFAILLGMLLILLMAAFAWAENRVVRVGVYENAPKVFTSESGKPSGIFIDIIEYIAKQEDWDLEYVTGTWIEGLDRLDRGEIDLMPDVAFTAERDKKFPFHKIQVLSSELAPKEPAIYAKATLAMVVSSTSINAAKLTTTETRKGRSGRCMAASILKNRSFRKYRGLYGHAGPQMDGAFRLRF